MRRRSVRKRPTVIQIDEGTHGIRRIRKVQRVPRIPKKPIRYVDLPKLSHRRPKKRTLWDVENAGNQIPPQIPPQIPQILTISDAYEEPKYDPTKMVEGIRENPAGMWDRNLAIPERPKNTEMDLFVRDIRKLAKKHPQPSPKEPKEPNEPPREPRVLLSQIRMPPNIAMRRRRSAKQRVKPKKDTQGVSVMVDATYLKHTGEFLPVTLDRRNTYPVPVTIVRGVPCYSVRQLNDLWYLLRNRILSPFLSATPIFDQSGNVTGFQGPTPWYVYETTWPEEKPAIPGPNSKYYVAQEFRDKFGHTFVVRRGVGKVAKITRNRCEEFPASVCDSSTYCKLQNGMCRPKGLAKGLPKDVWEPKGDPVWERMVRDALADLRELLRVAYVNGPIYLRVRDQHEMAIRKYLAGRDPGRAESPKVRVPRPKLPGEEEVDLERFAASSNGIPVPNFARELLRRGYVVFGEGALEVMREPLKYFPGYRRNMFVASQQTGLLEVATTEVDPVLVLRNMSRTHSCSGLEAYLPMAEGNRRLVTVGGVIYDYLCLAMRAGMPPKTPVVISARDVVEYLGDSYLQYVEYPFGMVFDDKRNIWKYLTERRCEYAEVPVSGELVSDFLYNGKFYLAPKELWSANSITSNSARRLAMVLGRDLTAIPPCYSSKPYERSKRTGALISNVDVEKWLLRSGQPWYYFELGPEDARNPEEREKLEDAHNKIRGYLTHKPDVVWKEMSNPKISKIVIELQYMYNELEFKKDKELEKRVFLENINKHVSEVVENNRDAKRQFADAATHLGKFGISANEWVNPVKRPLSLTKNPYGLPIGTKPISHKRPKLR